ncbi:radical SAM/SPASM domain-containing protein [Alphaproteobacteria bacterium LSUCC0744]
MKQGKYDKAGSLLEMRAGKSLREEVVLRLKSIQGTAENLDSTDPARLAIRDIFGGEGSKFFLREHVVEELARLRDEELIPYLRYRYKYELYPQHKILDKYPPLVQIEPTSICNYRCVFCYQTDPRLSSKKNGHMGNMDINLFCNLIDQLQGNVEGITLASRGEPTVHKNLSKMLDYIGGKFVATKLNTNAFLLNEAISRSILDADIQTLVFSADAASEPLYSQLRVNGNLDRVVRNVERFYEIKEREYPKSRLITRVSGVRFKSEQSIDAMEKFWKRFVDQVAFVDYNPWENVYDASEKGINEPCSDLWRRMFVWWDGKVAPCDVDYLTTLGQGVFPNQSIPEIWNGEMYQRLRQKHLDDQRKHIEPCRRCVVV